MLNRVYAQVSSDPTDPLGTTFGTNVTLRSIFGMVLNIVIGVGVALSIIFLALGGIKYISSKGDAKAAEEARSWLTNAIIGFLVVIGAFTIRYLVVNLLGADITTIGTDITF